MKDSSIYCPLYVDKMAIFRTYSTVENLYIG